MADKLEIGLLKANIEELKKDNRALTYALAACFVEGAKHYRNVYTNHSKDSDPEKLWDILNLEISEEAYRLYPMTFKPYPE